MRAGYLGPPGTNSHDALVGTGLDVEQVALPTVPAVIRAVQDGEIDRGLVPLENSREGAVGSTLDSLVFDAPDVRIVGEVVHAVTYCLAAAEWIAPDEVCTVHSHPQALGQCAGFLRAQLPGAAIVAERSTADAIRSVTEGGALAGSAPHAAIGTRHAARLYGAAVLAEDIEDDADNATRFAWIARDGDTAGTGTGTPPGAGPGKTILVFWGAGDLAPGWLVDCLGEFASRGINLSRIESRPRRIGLGHYMFICDLEGAVTEAAVADAIAGLGRRCEAVRVLGSFAAAA
jgi:prephenate dehydratase